MVSALAMPTDLAAPSAPDANDARANVGRRRSSSMDSPVSQGVFEGFGDWSGAVMYSAFFGAVHDRGPRWVLRIGLPALRRAWIAR